MSERLSKTIPEVECVLPEIKEFKKILSLKVDPGDDDAKTYENFGPNAEFMAHLAKYLAARAEPNLPADTLHELCTAVRLVFRKIKGMKDTKRLEMIKALGNIGWGDDFAELNGCPAIKNLAKIKCISSLNHKESDEDGHEHIDYSSVVAMVVSAIVRKNGSTDPDLLAKAYASSRVIRDENLLPELIPSLPDNERNFWICVQRLSHNWHTNDLANVMLENKKGLPALSPDGAITNDFFTKLIAVGGWRVEGYNAGPEAMAMEEAGNWDFWVSLQHRVRCFAARQPNLAARMIREGKAPPDFFLAVLQANDPFLLTDAYECLPQIDIESLPLSEQALLRTLRVFPRALHEAGFFEATNEGKEKICDILQNKSTLAVLQNYRDLASEWNLLLREYVQISIKDPVSGAKVASVLCCPEMLSAYRNISPLIARRQLVKGIMACPQNGDTYLKRLQGASIQTLTSQFPQDSDFLYSTALNLNVPFEPAASEVANPKFQKFLEANPRLLQDFFVLHQNLPNLSREERFLRVVSLVLGKDYALGLILKQLEVWADMHNKDFNEIILKRIGHFSKFLTDPENFRTLAEKVQLSEEAITGALSSMQRPNERYAYLFKVLPLCTNLPVRFYREAISRPTLPLTSRERENLLTELDRCQHIMELASDRGRLAGLASRLNPKASLAIVREVMDLNYSSDEGEYRIVPQAVTATDGKTTVSFEQRMRNGGFNDRLIDQCTSYRQYLLDILAEDVSNNQFGSSPRLIHRVDSFLVNASSTQLSQHALEFEVYHERLRTTKIVPAFRSLWTKKITGYFEDAVLETGPEILEAGATLTAALSLYQDGIRRYDYTETQAIPALVEMNKFLKPFVNKPGIWFSGRDCIPLYTAVKAAHFGTSLRPNLKIAYISRLVFENATNEDKLQAVKSYVISLGINMDMLAVDTGFEGSVIKKVQGLFGAVRPEHIALLKAKPSSGAQQILTDPGEAVDLIERLPKPFDRTITFINGKPFRLPFKADTVLLSWVVNHAIMRHFMPKVDKNLST